MAEQFEPCFQMLRGAMDGYDQEDFGVTEKNVEAVIGEFFDFERLQMEGATESWEAFWDHVHKDEQFWWKYYCGRECEIKTTEGWPTTIERA